ncbi:glutaredoxin domain-containing protein [Nocardioides sp. YIM 152315]|uniref:glutaredoxin domain-containing protein n=1 Tax=Nocardioides sp. YIM 152315 TaxID=3031760 RepID=UPI0023DC0727|nr:glutaredoxin domain-containing protein [Nocardioides sp. YIM 152315]MDF1602635.1 glutaredoxin domain-containing protein [Nocardioides sp. YIM 152315]
MISVVVLVVAAVVLLVTVTPVAFPRSPGDAAGRAAAEARGVPIVYWRPGCTFCVRMRLALGRSGGRAVWVNIHRDPAAAARVRSVNDGNETVPTVFVGDEHRTNPPPSWVRERLRRPAER